MNLCNYAKYGETKGTKGGSETGSLKDITKQLSHQVLKATGALPRVWVPRELISW